MPWPVPHGRLPSVTNTLVRRGVGPLGKLGFHFWWEVRRAALLGAVGPCGHCLGNKKKDPGLLLGPGGGVLQLLEEFGQLLAQRLEFRFGEVGALTAPRVIRAPVPDLVLGWAVVPAYKVELFCPPLAMGFADDADVLHDLMLVFHYTSSLSFAFGNSVSLWALRYSSSSCSQTATCS